jgi:hypothetical protein
VTRRQRETIVAIRDALREQQPSFASAAWPIALAS